MPSQCPCPAPYPIVDQANLSGKSSRHTSPFPVPNSAADQSSFVSGGSRPTAPIKTAIIRPTNYYDGSRRASFGSSPDSQLKRQQGKGDKAANNPSVVTCDSSMSPLTPEAESDPLSDNGAVMYGTNATRRRKSKVEAWIESSSSAQSEESLSDSRAFSVPLNLRRKPAMNISSNCSTLSKEEVDLSFENLCQELLALSASCSTLERMINNTSQEIDSTRDSSLQASAGRKKQKKVKGCSTQPSGMGRSLFIEEPTDTLSSNHSGYLLQPDGDATLSPHRQNGNNLSSQALPLPKKKMAALTVDVGTAAKSYPAVANIPIEGSLVTITSPKSPLNVSDNHSRRKLSSKTSLSNSSSSAVDGNSSAQYNRGSETSQSAMRGYRMQNGGSQSASGRDRDPAAKDHVAAAITTQPANHITSRSQPTVIHRSVSEPASFVTLPPDKRTSLIRSPSKRELKSRQQLRVGMDFIRRNPIPSTAAATPSTSATPCFTSKDNMLMNNLDICSQAKPSADHPNKMNPIRKMNLSTQSQAQPVLRSLGSDSVFDENITEYAGMSINSFPPSFSSTCKQVPMPGESTTPAQTPAVDRTKTTNESLSSSFESEALDILASLKSANALKAQLRHGKFPTDVDPVTGSPRGPPLRLASEEKLRLMEGLNYSNRHTHSIPNSNKSSCLNSPNGSNPAALHHGSVVTHRSPAHCQTPQSRRSRQSYYDNVLQSPFGGLRISVASGSSTGTIFSRPWGDLPRLDDYMNHNDEFRHRVGSMVSSQGRSVESGSGMLSPPRHHSQRHQHGMFKYERSRSTSCSHSGSDEQNSYHNLSSIPRFPVTTLPDVTLEADMNRQKSSWEIAIDRALNRVRAFTKLLQSTDNHSCEITRYTQTLLSDSHSLPGTLVGRFHTCTWETNSLDRINYTKQNNRSKSPSKTGRREATPKTDWYSNNIQRNGGCDRNGKVLSSLAYSNGGYLVNQCSGSDRDGTEANSSGTKEHIVLSNVRQFIDGMKRFLLNRPDTQMMFAIQREKIKSAWQLDANQLINLDAIMEAVLERVVLQPLSDHLLNAITTHPDYSIREITQIESGMKAILQYKCELFANLQAALSEIDSYDQTLRLVFQSFKSEFSPMSKLQYLLQIALLLVLITNRSCSNRDQDLQMLFIYTMARYGDATLLVHLAYIRHLIPMSMKGGATLYVLSLLETTVQVYSRIVKVPGALARRMRILHEILEKLSCHLMIADESTNRVIRKKISLSRWSTASELIEMMQVELANHELNDYRLYLATDEKDVLLRANDNVSEQLMAESRSGFTCALVYRRPNTQMVLPPP